MYNIPNEVQIGTLRVSLLCEHWCSVLPTDSTGAFFGYIYIIVEHLLCRQTEFFGLHELKYFPEVLYFIKCTYNDTFYAQICTQIDTTAYFYFSINFIKYIMYLKAYKSFKKMYLI